jgi:hypothetical protein
MAAPLSFFLDGMVLIKLLIHPQFSAYTLKLPPALQIWPTFYADELKPYIDNDPNLFPHGELPCPGPVVTSDGLEEWTVSEIIDKRKHGRGKQYLVQWLGFGKEPGSSL